MRSIPYTRLLRKVSQAAGLGYPPQVEDADTLREFIDTRLGVAWETGAWPEWELEEERVIRPEYDATAIYALDTEVYGLDTGLYYRALAALAAGVPLTDTASWLEITVNPLIEYEQEGLEPIGEFLCVWDADPRRSAAAREIGFELTADGADLLRFSGNSVWVKYRLRRPFLEGDDWDPETTYGVGATCYYTREDGSGDFYQSIQAANTNQAPDATPEYWSVLTIPYALEPCLVQYALGDWFALPPADTTLATAAWTLGAQLYAAAQDKIQRQQGQLPIIRHDGY